MGHAAAAVLLFFGVARKGLIAIVCLTPGQFVRIRVTSDTCDGPLLECDV